VPRAGAHAAYVVRVQQADEARTEYGITAVKAADFGVGFRQTGSQRRCEGVDLDLSNAN